MNQRDKKGRCMNTFKFLMPLILCQLMHLQVNAQPVPASESIESDQIRIGLLLTEDPENSRLMREAVDVVALAAEIVNEAGGIRQKPVKIIAKSVDGNWGAGSKQAVSLIYEHQTTALLGFVDGRSAHLIEQVCTKAEIPFISTLSPDPSLSRINIPWFFSTLPHADQQSAVLAEALYSNIDGRNILVVTSDDYDQEFISHSFVDIATDDYREKPAIFRYSAGKNDFSGITSTLSKPNADAIVFFGASNELDSLTEQLRLADVDVPVYTPIMDLNTEISTHYSSPIYTLRSRSPIHQDTEAFKARFLERHGYMPGIQTTYLYDGLKLLLRAIRVNGEASDHIRGTLSSISEPASFDSEGVIKQFLTVVQIHSETRNR